MSVMKNWVLGTYSLGGPDWLHTLSECDDLGVSGVDILPKIRRIMPYTVQACMCTGSVPKKII